MAQLGDQWPPKDKTYPYYHVIGLEAQIDRLRRSAKHKPTCMVQIFLNGDEMGCTCGLESAHRQEPDWAGRAEVRSYMPALEKHIDRLKHFFKEKHNGQTQIP